MLATSTHAALADQYLDRLAFGWQRRIQALDSHVLDASGLSVIDRDLQSYSRGLSTIGTASSTLIHERLLEPLTRGELFAIAHHAIRVQDQPMHNACIGLIESIPTLRAAYASALEWSTSDGAWWAISEWRQHTEIQTDKGFNLFDVIALSACRYHFRILEELCNTSWWSGIIKSSDDHADRADTTCALMQLGLATAHPQAIGRAAQLLQSPVAQLRCLAAEVMLWQPTKQLTKYDARIAEQRATDVLLELSTGTLEAKNIVSQASYALACWNHAEFDTVLTSLAAQPEKLDVYLQSLGWSGNGQRVPILIAYLNHPEHARGAGAALSMLTGSLPARDGWQAEPGESENALIDDPVDAGATIPSTKRYANLPPPDQAGFERWWAKNKTRFHAQSSWIAGLSDTNDNLIVILQSGKLAWRALAARRLHARLQGRASLNTSAPMPQQRQWISNFIASPTRRNAA
ncbi:hypothetical protein [Massilia aquatica]|uniref:TIGR02270 family protein n=1 Tax=Massilia aquatica TaxID=2609000 RepID=A0ABX0LW27_9BURK|nr:hypothetical protein [Massilia aquatica]NHZ38960.1 hypothetical protein [Massilia aquatica]